MEKQMRVEMSQAARNSISWVILVVCVGGAYVAGIAAQYTPLQQPVQHQEEELTKCMGGHEYFFVPGSMWKAPVYALRIGDFGEPVECGKGCADHQTRVFYEEEAL
jgi:hypothetical protein